MFVLFLNFIAYSLKIEIQFLIKIKGKGNLNYTLSEMIT